MAQSVIEIVEASGKDDLIAVRALFAAYAESQPDDVCFAGFDAETADLPGLYAEPGGRLLLARGGAAALGCVALTPSHGCCEMRRLYVVPNARRSGTGRRLVSTVIETARTIGYRKMILSTRPHMKDALRLYRSMGFKTMPPPPGEPPSDLIWMIMSLIRHRKPRTPSPGPTGRRP